MGDYTWVNLRLKEWAVWSKDQHDALSISSKNFILMMMNGEVLHNEKHVYRDYTCMPRDIAEVERVIINLPRELKNILIGKWIYHLSDDSICKILHIGHSTYRAHRHRMYECLAVALQVLRVNP